MSIISPTVTGVTAFILVESGRKGTFRVRCSINGGGGLNVSVTGASNFSTNIRRVIDSNGVGKDTYHATTDIIPGGRNRDNYWCTASNGVSSKTKSVQLRGYKNSIWLIPLPIFSHIPNCAYYLVVVYTVAKVVAVTSIATKFIL